MAVISYDWSQAHTSFTCEMCAVCRLSSAKVTPTSATTPEVGLMDEPATARGAGDGQPSTSGLPIGLGGIAETKLERYDTASILRALTENGLPQPDADETNKRAWAMNALLKK